MQGGYHVVVCGTGDDALSSLAREQFDVVLVDRLMPKMGGIETTRAIRARTRTPPPTIVMMSADVSNEMRSMVTSGEIKAVLEKPIKLADFMRVIEKR